MDSAAAFQTTGHSSARANARASVGTVGCIRAIEV